jgi:pyrimidine operon attenuation protein/uracil phosphoribosyltransferase
MGLIIYLPTMRAKTVLNTTQLDLTINRLSYELIENHNDFSQSVIIGMQPRGVEVAQVIHQKLEKITGQTISCGQLDASFYRDDFRRRDTPIEVAQTNIDFLIENKRVILIDDVLFTGRTVRAALDALMDFGRPKDVEFAVLVERRFRKELPVTASYVGRSVDAMLSERVDVQWNGAEGKVLIKKVSQ